MRLFLMLLLPMLAFSLSSSCSSLARTRRAGFRPRALTSVTSDTSVAAVESERAVEPPLLQLIEERDFGGMFKRASAEPAALNQLLEDAGGAGIISYVIAWLAFYSVAMPAGYVSYHIITGQWLDLGLLFASDDAEGKARTLALVGTYYLSTKPFAPVRLGGALLLTPYTKRRIEANPAIGSFLNSTGETTGAVANALGGFLTVLGGDNAARRALKAELIALSVSSRGGILPFAPGAEQARWEEILAELQALNPTPEPARSPMFSGEWELAWTTETELNFVVERGLFGCAHTRTYQTIDIGSGAFDNVIEFEAGGALSVGATIAPDESDPAGARFVFAFEACGLRWRGLALPLPPVGRGWCELLYLDEELRLQHDLRGDLLIATRAAPR